MHSDPMSKNKIECQRARNKNVGRAGEAYYEGNTVVRDKNLY